MADLCVPVAAGVALLGWASSRLLEFSAWPFAPLWFAGTLLVYTCNRLRRDPADAINCPWRLDVSSRMRRARIVVLIASGCAVAVWPIVVGDGFLSVGALGAATVGIGYVAPLPGVCRLKDLPVAKTFLPAIVVSAVILYPALGRGIVPRAIGPGAAWLLCLTLLNATLCDHLDREGDTATGVRTIPVLLGASWSRILIWIMAAATIGCALMAAAMSRDHALRAAWRWTAALLAPYLALLAARAEQIAPDHGREWLVEGMLFVPAAACLLANV